MTQSPNKEALEEIVGRQITDCCLWIDRLSKDKENLIQSRMIGRLSKRLQCQALIFLELLRLLMRAKKASSKSYQKSGNDY